MADKIVHFDITGPELAPLSKFYSELFGWRVADQNGGYAQVETADLRGGLLESESTGVHFGVQVDDLQAAVDKATELGGTIDMPVTDNGWVIKAQVRDPAGNTMSLIQSDDQPAS